MHESVEDPEPVTLVGISVQPRPVDGNTVAERLTTPPKPERAVTVTVEVPAVPALVDTDVGLAATAKSCTA